MTLFLSAQLLHSELECSCEIPDLFALFKRAVILEIMAKRGVESLETKLFQGRRRLIPEASSSVSSY